MKQNVPALGFPEEAWDNEGDYVCRPREDIIACVIKLSRWNGYEYDVSIVPYVPGGGSISEIWAASGPDIAQYYVDCPLQAQACIYHYLETNPFTPTASKGDPNGEH